MEYLTDKEIEWVRKEYNKSHPSKESKNNILAKIITYTMAAILPVLLIIILFSSQALIDIIDLPTYGISMVAMFCIFFCVASINEVQINIIKLQNIKKISK